MKKMSDRNHITLISCCTN